MNTAELSFLPFSSPMGQCDRNCRKCSTFSTNVSKNASRSSFPSTSRSDEPCGRSEWLHTD